MAGFLSGLSVGGAIGGAVVRLYLDDDQYQTQLTAAGVRAKESAGTQASAFSKLKMLGVAAFTALGAGALAFAADAMNAYREAQQVQAELERSVGDLAQSYSDLAQALALKTGLDDEDISRSVILLHRYQLTNDEIQRAIPLLLDYARATGKTVADSASVLGKALLGNTRGLKEIGIQFTATGNTGKDLNTILTEMETRIQGAADTYARTAEGQIQRANQRWEQAKETLGKFVSDAVIPVIDGMPALQDAVDGAAQNVGAAVNRITRTFAGAGVGADHMADDIQGAGRRLHQFAGMVGKDFREWRTDLRRSMNDVVFALDNTKDHFEVSRKSFIAGTRAMLGRSKELARAMTEISKEKWVNDDYIKFLSEQGPEWMVGFSKLTESEQRKAQSAWETTTKKTNDAKSALDKITGAAHILDRTEATATVTVQYKYVGYDPTKPGQ